MRVRVTARANAAARCSGVVGAAALLFALPFAGQPMALAAGVTWEAQAQLQPPVPAPGDSVRPLLDRALLSSRPADYDRVLIFLEMALVERPDDPVLHHYRGFALFRKASILGATKGDTKVAKALFEEAERALVRSEQSLAWPETRALRSAVVGQLISLGGRLSAMRLGVRVITLMNEAAALGPENPRVWMLRGVATLYKPRMFGGGADKAEGELQRALQLFESDHPAPPAPWWGHAEAHGWLGQAYAAQGKTAEARAAYTRALELQPGNSWVRDFLIPALERGKA